jgi:hypothetical protein
MDKRVHEDFLQCIQSVLLVGPAEDASGEALKIRAVEADDLVKGVGIALCKTARQVLRCVRWQ